LLLRLEALGQLEETLVVGTADHGNSFGDGRPRRSWNLFEEVLGVPLFVHVPASWARRSAPLWAALAANRGALVTNLDIYPTLLDVWGRWPLEAGRPALAGVSLLRPVPADRMLLSTARGATYDEATDGFAVYHGRWKWILEEKRGLQLFDLESDPGETSDRRSLAPPEEVGLFAAEIRRHPRAFEALARVDPRGAR
jgi:choline-sulfatase